MPATQTVVLTWSGSLVLVINYSGSRRRGSQNVIHCKHACLGQDLAHWVFVLIAVLLFTGVGIVYSLYS